MAITMMAVLRYMLVSVLLFHYQGLSGKAQTVGVTFGGVDANNVLLTLGDVGTSDNDTLRCFTDRTSCCGTVNNSNGEGDWYDQEGIKLGSITSGNELYSVWGSQEVRLNYRGNGTAGSTGLFRCDIRDIENTQHIFYVGVYLQNEGTLNISSSMTFTLHTDINVDPPEFSLTCTSTGGPATIATWTLFGMLITSDDSSYGFSQNVTDHLTSTYSNVLTVTGRQTGTYQCSVSNARNSGNPVIRSLTVTAVNPPTGLRATLDQDSNIITVSWTPPPATPTGYVIYYQIGNENQSSVMVNNGSTSQKIITGIQADRVYYITLVSLSNYLPSAASVSVMASRKETYMVLNDQVIPNHGLVFHSDIGLTAETGLRCVTRRMDCCSGGTGQDSDEAIAEWFNTKGKNIAQSAFARSRRGEGEEFGYVNLFKRNPLNSEGIYRCIIPQSGSDSLPVIDTFYVGIYNTGGGSLSIPYHIHFSIMSAPDATTPIFTLTCFSTGGPATIMRWTLNNTAITEDSSHVFTQVVINTETAVYNNTLTVIGNGEPGRYQCTVANSASISSAVFTGNAPSSPDFTSPPSTVDTSSVLVHWSTVESGGIPLLKYEVSYVRASGLSDQVGCEFEHSDTITVSSQLTEYTITGLEEYSTYIISVAAVNVFGTSQPSIQQVITSSSAPTGAPQGLQSIATTDTSITIQWWPVECTEQNSLITHYVVKYVHGPTDGSTGTSISKIIYGAPENGGMYVIVGLSLGVQYFIQVAAVNNNGVAGPFSDPIIAETITQCESKVAALVGVGVGCSLGVTLLYTAVLGITIILWKKTRSIEMKECIVYNKPKAVQPKPCNDELYESVT